MIRKELTAMTKKEKIKQEFLLNPRNLDYKKISSFLQSEGYTEEGGKGSHIKIKFIKSGESFTVPVHNGDCKGLYKEKLKDFYLKNN